jgi:hypothetical protein
MVFITTELDQFYRILIGYTIVIWFKITALRELRISITNKHTTEWVDTDKENDEWIKKMSYIHYGVLFRHKKERN